MRRSACLLAPFFAFLLIVAAGCDSVLDVNENPNATTDPSQAGLLSSTIYNTSELTAGAASVTSYYVQHLASPSGSSIDRHYEVRLGGTWASVYSVLADLNDLKAKAAEENSPHYAGVAKVIEAYNLGLATDLWGAIPYDEALQGGENITPSYDEQEAIYAQIQSLLDSAIQDLQASASTFSPAEDDFVYGGDLTKWRRAAYALKARYLNHLSKKGSYDPQAVLDAVDNAFQRNADDMQMNYEGAVGERNPWNLVVIENQGGILGGFLSEQLVNAMDGTTYGVFDPRLPQITDSLTAAEGFTPPPYFIGTVNGKGSPNTPYNFLVGTSIYDQETSPIYWVTYAEVKFIEAEAALRAGQPARAYNAYREGIRAHMDKVGVPADARDAYLSDPNVAVGANNLTMEHVMKEKHIALFLNPEAWVDARRYDYQYADMEPPFNQNPDLSSDYIRRVLYPNSELQRNENEVPPAQLGEHLWWDQS